MSSVANGAQKSEGSAHDVLSAGGDVAKQSDDLRIAVEEFLSEIRAA